MIINDPQQKLPRLPRAKGDFDFAAKNMLSTAALAAGICLVILFSISFLPFGIALIIISSMVLYEHIVHYDSIQNLLSKTSESLKNTAEKARQWQAENISPILEKFY